VGLTSEYFMLFNADTAFAIYFIPSPGAYFTSSTCWDTLDFGLELTDIIRSSFLKKFPLIFLFASNPIISLLCDEFALFDVNCLSKLLL